MSIPHILTEVTNKPLMITPAKLQTIMGILDLKNGQPLNLDLSALSAMSSNHGGEGNISDNPERESVGEIAVLTVRGSLVSRNHGFNDDSGLRSYRTLQREISCCLSSDEIGGIILDLDTYGGMSAGCERLARFINEGSQIKPIYALVDLNAYSAGYYIAAACSKVVLSDNDAGVGSIGCLAIHGDHSKHLENEGHNYTVVTFGKYKDEMSPYRPLDSSEMKILQKGVDASGMRFAKSVAEFRGMDIDDVLDTEARCYEGQNAIDIGLADCIASFEETVGMLRADIKNKNNHFYGVEMTTKERMEGLLSAEDGAESIKELGFVKREDFFSKAEADGKIEEASSKAVAAAVGEMKGTVVEMAQLCVLADAHPKSLLEAVESGATVDQYRETLQREKAAKSKQTKITSTVTAGTRDGKHPLVEACEKMNK